MEHLEKGMSRQLYADPAGAARQARDKLAAARVWLMKHKPFFGVLVRAFRLETRLDVPAFRLMPDDRLLCNPIVTLQARFGALCARLAHLSLHAALGAFGRRREREPRRWNLAHDLAIAPLLDAAQLSVGEAAWMTGLPQRASAEAYYDLLDAGSAPDALWCDLCDPLPTDDAPPAGQYTRQDGGDQPSDDQQRRGTEALDSADGPWPSIDARERELQWKMRLGAAYEEELASDGKTFGDMPEWLEDLVRATIEPPADWSAVLQQAVTSLHRTDRTYLRPSRRMAALACDSDWPEVVSMPGRRVQQAGQLVVVVDTSASLQPATVARFLGSVAAVATAEGIDEVRLMQADAAVTRDETRFAAELLFDEVTIIGRGGTNFGPALLQLAAEAKRLAQRFTVAYLTDLKGRFPPSEGVQHLDVLWVVPHKTDDAPPFGRVVEMTEPGS